MFGLFKKKKNSFLSPMTGKSVSIKEVPDETFSSEMLGKGVAIIPSDGLVTSPTSGKVSMIFETLHAISILADTGEEILIHIGLDTVKMNGDGFSSYVKVGDTVKPKDPLIKADLEKIKSAGFNPITIMLICNSTEFKSVESVTNIPVTNDSEILVVIP
ncbi:PTS sugar transporter subunit IIA [Lachnoanaerobaculum umeaense]|uniref:PTS glucose transporter subunit IIA n=1 Tax=Lachnoanaerobaculum umeaense TaxID=617123 RepID=A0A385Q2H7_9FIRM|nr:PTS glucose transporter subunit IIA [Lachnoanaerobaculum umeaense]AYB00571.1 PTS glucose transporter subunit IIA [Lachnoanaerobaculum umeaense]PZW92580.1 PTS system IIA component (Glc family) [Lachnoanaerobaculum umeaense]